MQNSSPMLLAAGSHHFCFLVSILDAIDFLFGYFMVWLIYRPLLPHFGLLLSFWMPSHPSVYWKPYLVFLFLWSCKKCQQLGQEDLRLLLFWYVWFLVTNFFLFNPSLFPTYCIRIVRCSSRDFWLKSSNWSPSVSVAFSSWAPHPPAVVSTQLSSEPAGEAASGPPCCSPDWGCISLSPFLAFLLWKPAGSLL